MKHSNSHSKGYTFIELMVVVGIISLLLAFSINALYNLQQWNKLSTAAALLSSELKNTQSRAFYEGVYYKLQFWPTLDRYRIYKQSELIEDIQLKDVNLFNTNFTNNNLYFYPNGVPGQGGTVTLKNKIGKVLHVIMTPVTARIRISPEPPENW
ncbi:MAG: prepilin-type N-terminal cleavage/methylation domain-containing protein [Candidatus Atribacteria bacterium]|nr:MAG: prepilin-type N-terminal cleavage/methylation domain-containing protein [Candidatus Atribacteria bacterium]